MMPNHGKSIFLMAALLMGVSFQACAQVGCPPGYYPIGGANAGWHDCAPAGNSAAPPEPGPSWVTQWGSIAAGKGGYGKSVGSTSKSRAKREALRECKASGGKKCEVLLVFYNQCGALAWGNTGNATFRAPSAADAEAGALGECAKHAADCRVFYSGCSYPRLIE